jgi:hypothetical protein
MFLESHLAWATALSGVALWFLVAGPGSDRPIGERLLVWLLAGTLLFASIPRLVENYDPTAGLYAGQIGMVGMVLTRYAIMVLCVYRCFKWAYRCTTRWMTPREYVGSLLASHKRTNGSRL